MCNCKPRGVEGAEPAAETKGPLSKSVREEVEAVVKRFGTNTASCSSVGLVGEIVRLSQVLRRIAELGPQDRYPPKNPPEDQRGRWIREVQAEAKQAVD